MPLGTQDHTSFFVSILMGKIFLDFYLRTCYGARMDIYVLTVGWQENSIQTICAFKTLKEAQDHGDRLNNMYDLFCDPDWLAGSGEWIRIQSTFRWISIERVELL